MKKLILIILILTNSFAFLGIGKHNKKVCYCAGKITCASVIINLIKAKKVIELNYKILDKMMSMQMNAIKNEEKQIKKKQAVIAKLTYQIRRIQQAIALEEKKKRFLLNKIKQLETYKEK